MAQARKSTTKTATTKKAAADTGKTGKTAKTAARSTKAKAAPKPKAAGTKTAPKKTAPKAASKKAAPKAASKKSATARKSPSGSGIISEEQLRKMPESAYMNDQQLAFFRQRLLEMRQEVVDRELDVKRRLHEREVFADPADRATAEEEHWLDLRLRERESLLLKKIDESLRRIEDKEYGWCEVTGEPIGIPRLLARPTATVCVDVKGENEHIEAQYRDR